MWRNRIFSASLVGAFVALLRPAVPDPALREHWLVLLAVPIGYGHLLGAVLFGRRRLLAARPKGASPALHVAFWCSSAATLLSAYCWALRQGGLTQLLVVVPMLLVSAWHIVENDLELGRAYRRGLRLGPGRRADRPRVALLLLALAAWALATPDGVILWEQQLGAAPFPPLFELQEVATLVLLYHAASWVLFFVSRGRSLPPAEARELYWKLFWIHAIPVAGNAAGYLWLPSVYLLFGPPAMYLFWSVLHAFQTAVLRRAPA